MAPIKDIEYFRVPPRWIFVKITDSDGKTGWGEASLEGNSEAVEGCLDGFRERFVGMEANEIENIWQHAYRGSFYRGGPVIMSALAGIDIALWDLKARRLNVPIYELLGGKVRSKIKVYTWTIANVLSFSLLRKEQGFKAVKMTATEDLGWVDSPAALNDAVERLKAVKATGVDCGLDFHGRVHKPMVKLLARKLEPHEPLFIEEPLLSDHPEGFRSLDTTIPVALGERLHSRWAFKPFLELGKVDILQPDISHAGGISELRRIATMAEAYDVSLAPHCPLGPIALAANFQVNAVSANFFIQEMILDPNQTLSVGQGDLKGYTKNAEVWTVNDGMIDMMDGPGLGIEVDEERVRQSAVGTKSWRFPTFKGPGGELREW
ncbi:hypothetical protein AYO22_01379 [Fonsecaea multimorphosa]|nr:hypothetical protein AYO22_01379 [Fonsecaea multimorphosa]